MIIDRAMVEDAEELLEIYAPYVRDTAISFEYEVPSVDEFKNRITNISCRYPYIKAVSEGKIVGYAYATSFKLRKAYDWSVETTIYVRPECRKSGVGKALYAQLEKSLSDMGILNMNACIASPAEETKYLNDDSERFHEHMGFKLVGCFHNSGSKFGKWFNMVWMEKMIGNHTDSPVPVKFGEWNI